MPITIRLFNSKASQAHRNAPGGLDDPFRSFVLPPPSETHEEKAARLIREAEAKRISDEIDQAITEQKRSRRKRPSSDMINILLLGPEGGGKSTVLKNMKMRFAPSAWNTERTYWRAAILLNLVRAVKIILQASSECRANYSDIHDGYIFATLGALPSQGISRLRELEDVEAELQSLLRHGRWDPILSDQLGRISTAVSEWEDETKALWEHEIIRDVAVRRNPITDDKWADGAKLEKETKYYMDNFSVICSQHNQPSDEDIANTWVKTAGVEEHTIQFESDHNINTSYLVHDTSGYHSKRSAWLRYSENIHLIMLVVPLVDDLVTPSAFGKIEAYYELWKVMVSSRFLTNSSKMLLLNKFDLLEQRFDEDPDFQLGNYITAYGDRPNNAHAYAKYLQEEFRERYRTHSPFMNAGQCSAYVTTATDIQAASVFLSHSGSALFTATATPTDGMLHVVQYEIQCQIQSLHRLGGIL